jgi:hypothetical protein
MRFSAKRWAYSAMPIFSRLSEIHCIENYRKLKEPVDVDHLKAGLHCDGIACAAPGGCIVFAQT